MSDKSQPTSTPTKPARDLTPGDWMLSFLGDPAEALYVDTYKADGCEYVAVVAHCDDGMTGIRQFKADDEIVLATPEVIAEFQESTDRRAVTTALHELARTIAEHALPVPKRAVDLRFALRGREDVETVGKALGLPVVTNGAVHKHAVYWPTGTQYPQAAVSAEFYTYEAPAPVTAGL